MRKRDKKRFVVHASEYMCEEPDMYTLDRVDFQSVLHTLFGTRSVKYANMSNGDGQPYFTILDEKTGKKVFG